MNKKVSSRHCTDEFTSAAVVHRSPGQDCAHRHFIMDGGGIPEVLPTLRAYWQRMVAGGGKSSFSEAAQAPVK